MKQLTLEFSDGVSYLPIPGFPGYRVGSDGTVWSAHNRNGTGITDNWRLLVATQGTHGYLRVGLRLAGRLHTKTVHRLVLSVFSGCCPEGMQAAHRDGNKLNNCLGNLRWATPKGNSADRSSHGTQVRGEHTCTAKLDDDAVREIRKRRLAGQTCKAIAESFGVAYQTISDVTRGQNWQHVA